MLKELIKGELKDIHVDGLRWISYEDYGGLFLNHEFAYATKLTLELLQDIEKEIRDDHIQLLRLIEEYKELTMKD